MPLLNKLNFQWLEIALHENGLAYYIYNDQSYNYINKCNDCNEKSLCKETGENLVVSPIILRDFKIEVTFKNIHVSLYWLQ